jgi:dolichol-phosphate mannosyltransferase
MQSPRLSSGENGHERDVSIVVPTYKEVESLPHLIDRIAGVRNRTGLDIEVLIMDDDSQDGSAELVARRGEPWVTMVVRTADRGLSAAVLDGMRRARGRVVVCMDADLSHPPEEVTTMLGKLDEGSDFVLGSRYVSGGTTSDDWGVFRWLNSRVATLFARPLTSVRDPMSGFFALSRQTFERGVELNPVGYKIGLELIVKCGCERVVEIPIHFEDRRFGKSKLTFKQQLLYLKHLRRLYIYKFGAWSQLLQFLVVGGVGTLLNLAVLTALIALGAQPRVGIAIAIAVTICSNFALNRRFSFESARQSAWPRQFARFVAASSVGAGINYLTSILVHQELPNLPVQFAALVGIAVGTAFNFLASRYLVFRSKHVRLPPPETTTPPLMDAPASEKQPTTAI